MYALLSGPEDELNPFNFSLAIVIVKRIQFALAPFYLGSLYTWLDIALVTLFDLWDATTW